MPAISLPKSLGTESTVLQWLCASGAAVRSGEPLVELLSEKATHVLVAEYNGTLLEIYAPAGAIVAAGEPLGWIGAAGQSAPVLRPRLNGWASEIALPSEPTPLASAASAVPASKPSKIPHSALRRTTAQRLSASWRAAPKVDLYAEVDYTSLIAHRANQRAQGSEAPSYDVYLAQAAAESLREHPEYNLHWRDGSAYPLQDLRIGIAVALEHSLLTVSLSQMPAENVAQAQQRLRKQIRKALRARLNPEDMFGNSLTITNLGTWGVRRFGAILNPPEIFILAVGEVSDRPVVRNGKIEVQPRGELCLSFDHRAIDGAPAAAIFQRIRHHLERSWDDR